MRECPNGTIIAQIPYGTELDVEIDGEWALTTYQNKKGYVKVSFLSTSKISQQDLKNIYNSLKATLKMIEEVLE